VRAIQRVGRAIDPRSSPRRPIAIVGTSIGIVIAAAGAVAGEPVAGVLAGAAGAGALAWLAFHVLRDQAEARQEARDLWGLTGVMVDGTAWPAPGGYALSAAALTRLLVEMSTRNCRTVVELGPGTSSIILGRSRPDLVMAGLEHDPRFLDATASALRLHGVGAYDLIHAPLTARAAHGGVWYDPSAVERLPQKIDVLVVDGPPNSDGSGARAPAWPVLRARMSPGGLVLVDDTDRDDERRMVASWASDGSLRVVADGGSYIVLEVT
jgi:hypothetical protein